MELQALDLEASYGPDSPGRAVGRLIDRNGKQRLGTFLWQTGQAAIDTLKDVGRRHDREYSSLRQLSDDLSRLIANANKILDDLLPWMIDQAREILFPTLNDDAKARMEQAPLPIKAEYFALIYFELQLHLKTPERVDMFQEFAALGILVLLDFAIRIEDQPVETVALEPTDVAARIGRLSMRLSSHNQLIPALDILKSDWSREHAQRGAAAKLAVDPRQIEKALVRACWDEWQKQSNRYTGKAEFARDMLTKLENLKSQAVIERWCREWEKENATKQAQ